MMDDDAPPGELAETLANGLSLLGLPLVSEQCEHLVAYVRLLNAWNKSFNLTAVRDPRAMVTRHLLDSLTIYRWLDDGPVLDIGTGAGLPGIPLAIARPGLRFTLLDSNRKKTRFVQQVVGELRLDNVEVVTMRIECLDRPGRYARITSRAFAALGDMVALSEDLLASGGYWLAMKGAIDPAELAGLPDIVEYAVETLPGGRDAAVRHLVRICRRGDPG
jgi:16S rRNA (guanine527-N7)-methyltransferase